MEEQIIIKGDTKKITRVLKICIIILVILFIVGLFKGRIFSTIKEIILSGGFGDIIYINIPITFILLTIALILITIIYFYLAKIEITVTNTRVFGAIGFGKRVDLPLDTISAIGTNFLKGIVVSTSSGKIDFSCIPNNNEIHAEISKLLNNRQNSKSGDTTIINNTSSNADELKKYKELLDTGVITQDEFEAKKKQLLNL